MDLDSFRLPYENMSYTTGLGLRYNTVIGPIQLDVGYKLNPPKNSTVTEPDVSGSADTARWNFYLNIGHAF
jgi:outer membrane protein assembly factor BamA